MICDDWRKLLGQNESNENGENDNADRKALQYLFKGL